MRSAGSVEKKLLKKMIRNYFFQYNYDIDSVPLTEDEYDKLYDEIKKQHHNAINISDLVNDVVYEYISK